MTRILWSFFLSMASLLVMGQNQAWTVSSSTVTFTIKNAGITVDGRFSDLHATVQFDATKGYGNKIEASLDSKTVNTGNNTRDGHLKKETYFDVEKFPKITMNASLFSKEADGKFKGFFALTIKGITKTIPVIFSYKESEGKASMAGTFKLNRLDFKVGESSWVLSDDVMVSITISLVKK